MFFLCCFVAVSLAASGPTVLYNLTTIDAEKEMKTLAGSKSVITFVGYSKAGYDDEVTLRAMINETLSKFDPVSSFFYVFLVLFVLVLVLVLVLILSSFFFFFGARNSPVCRVAAFVVASMRARRKLWSSMAARRKRASVSCTLLQRSSGFKQLAWYVKVDS